MNKKIITLTTGLVIGGTLLSTTAFASSNSTSGYDAYKNALMNMRNVKSMTDTISVSAADNGSELLKFNGNVKLNKDAGAMSGKFDLKAGAVEENEDVYRQNGKTITKNSDSNEYDIIDMGNNGTKFSNKKPDEKLTQQRMQNIENIVDALLGNRKNDFVLTDNLDGTKSVNVKFSEDQVVPVANAIASAIVRDREDVSFKAGNTPNKLNIELPKLEKDIRITNFDVTAVISSDNMIENEKGTITIAGKDSSGTEHTLSLNVDINVSSINKTAPDTVDLAGKQVKTVAPSQFHHNKRNQKWQ